MGNELLQQANTDKDPYQTKPSEIAGHYKEFCNQKNSENYHEKVMHGYMAKNIASDNEIDHKASLSWGKDKFIISHFESYAHVIKHHEIYTKDLAYRRAISNGNQVTSDSKCRLCKNKIEDITPMISGCSKMSARYYSSRCNC